MSEGRKRIKRTPWFGFDQQPAHPGRYEIREKGKPVTRVWWDGNNWRLSEFSVCQFSVVFCILHGIKWRGLAEKPE